MSDDDGLSERKKEAIEIYFQGVAEGKEMQEIADEIGVHRTTLWKWRKKGWFKEEWINIFDERMFELLPLAGKTFQMKLRSAIESEDPNRDAVNVANDVTSITGVKMDDGRQEAEAQPLQVNFPDDFDPNNPGKNDDEEESTSLSVSDQLGGSDD